METAVLGGGCFWCLEAVFEQVEGVASVVSGYCGGIPPAPSYHQVCEGNTGHAEVVKIEFDSEIISYRELLEIFFAIHDPTTRDRQGNDIGTQYRSVIFHQTPDQQRIAAALMAELESRQIWGAPMVTELLPAQSFYPAENYHQGYFRSNPGQGYCSFVVGPKVAKFRKAFTARLKPEYR